MPDRRKRPRDNDPDRRAPRGSPGSLRWLKSLLRRPLKLERRGIALHLRFVDRRRSDDVIAVDRMKQLCTDIGVRLLAQDRGHTVAVMRHLVAVHDVLARKGWAGIEVMSSGVLRRAGVQAQMLESQEASPALSTLIERLRLLAVEAELREEAERGPSNDESTPAEAPALSATST